MFRRDRWWAREIERINAAHEREREAWRIERKDLLDRVMYMANRPWEIPETPTEFVEPDEIEFVHPENQVIEENFTY